MVRPEKRPYYGQLVALDIDLCFLLSACRVLLSGYDRERVLVLVCFGLQYNEIICNVPEGMDVKLNEVSSSCGPPTVPCRALHHTILISHGRLALHGEVDSTEMHYM